MNRDQSAREGAIGGPALHKLGEMCEYDPLSSVAKTAITDDEEEG